jgi:hypothetical protein
MVSMVSRTEAGEWSRPLNPDFVGGYPTAGPLGMLSRDCAIVKS